MHTDSETDDDSPIGTSDSHAFEKSPVHSGPAPSLLSEYMARPFRKGQLGPFRRSATFAVRAGVEFSSSERVDRSCVEWPGMAVEVIQTARHDRIDVRFCAPVHMLVIHDRGERHAGETRISGLAESTLRNCSETLVFVPAGLEYHDWREARSLTRTAYFYFDPAWIAPKAQLGPRDDTLTPRLFFKDLWLWSAAQKVTALFTCFGPTERIYCEALSRVMAHELLKIRPQAARGERNTHRGLFLWQRKKALAYIQENLAESISVAMLAGLTRLSRSHFSRAFKQSLGMPPHRYHNSLRIERAKTLLEHSEASLTEIGLALGYCDSSAFSRTFRRYTGQTATMYRRGVR